MANSAFLVLVLVLFNLLPSPIHAVIVDQARKPYDYPVVKFNVTADEYSKLLKDILAIATRVPSTELAKHNVTKNEYSDLLKEILAVLSTNQSELDKHKVLPWQTGPKNEPPGWILIDLAGWDNVTTIALRADNLYLVGFTNRSGHWHTFDGYERLIPGSTRIGFRGSYPALGYERHYNPDLGYDEYPGLSNLTLNRTTVSTAVQMLLDYNNSSLADKEELKQALATLILVICEAARFTEISETVRNGWNSVSNINRTSILGVWSRLSYQLLRGWNNRTVVQDLENMFGIEGKEAAYLLLNVLILPTENACRNKQEDGRKKQEAGRKKQEAGRNKQKMAERNRNVAETNRKMADTKIEGVSG